MVEARGVEAMSDPHYSDGADAGERSARFSGTKATVPGNGFCVGWPSSCLPCHYAGVASGGGGVAAKGQ
jgi:hypothetical protein